MRFRLVPKSTTLGDLAQRIHYPGIAQSFKVPAISGTESYRLQIWPVHSWGPSEQKLINIFGEKGAWAYPGAAQSF